MAQIKTAPAAMFIVAYGAQVMSGVVQEKTNRIVEVIVSSVKPFELMMGKIIGIALVGLTQFFMWIVLTFIIFLVGTLLFAGSVDPQMLKQASEIGTYGVGQPHVVKKGETLYSIAEQYKVSVDDLKKTNHISRRGLKAGQEITINGAGVSGPVAAVADKSAKKKQESATTVYTVKKGETLSEIARKNNMGDVIGDLNKRRGQVEGMESSRTGARIVKAKVPLAETFGYVTALRTITSGRATSSMEFDHYAEVSSSIAKAVVTEAKGKVELL